VGVLATGALLLPAAPAAAGQFHGVDVIDDFDCDGVRDEVVLGGFYDVGSAERAGVILVRSGDGDRLTISQNTPGVPGSAETDDGFGSSYAGTDLDGDGCDELIVGSPGEDKDAGMVTIIPGSPTGLALSRSTAFTQNTPGVPGTSERDDDFGAVIVAGELGSGQSYLLVGSPGEAIGSKANAGSVYYLRGGVWRAFNQDSPGVAGTAESWDRFGATLAASDRHIVVGAPGETLSGRFDAGQVHVFEHKIVQGVPHPIASISQDSAGVSGTAEEGDGFGRDVSVISYRPSASAPIGALVAVGSPGEALGSDYEAGMAHVLAVTPTGKVTEVSDINQDTSGVADSTQAWDRFGTSLVLAVNGSDVTATPSTAMLVVGVPMEELAGDTLGAFHLFLNLKSPGDRDVWLPNATENLYDGYWNLTATTTSLITGEQDGSPSWEFTWTELLGGELSWPQGG
ncbi:MAG TPA: FG-GAP repeat protein, partial [Phytomonospora sp.]